MGRVGANDVRGGERATLRIATEAGSQPVVQGKVSGAIAQDFGTLPAEIPVSFTQEGTWKADILGWTAKPVQGSASLSAIVTPVGVLGPSLPGRPRILDREPSDGDKDVDPSILVRITFSEPVRGATALAFDVRVNDASVPFRVISNAREVTDGAALVQEVRLVADQRMTLGATVGVRAKAFITDQDGQSLEDVSWSFTVRGADEVGALAGVGTFSQMVAHKGRIYAPADDPHGTLRKHQGLQPLQPVFAHIAIQPRAELLRPFKGVNKDPLGIPPLHGRNHLAPQMARQALQFLIETFNPRFKFAFALRTDFPGKHHPRRLFIRGLHESPQ